MDNSMKLIKNPFPELSEVQLALLVASIKDYQLTHGSLIKRVRYEEVHTVQAHPIGVTLFPTPFPRTFFEHALSMQEIWNELYISISEDPEWLEHVLKDLLKSDPLTKALWTVYTNVKAEGFVQNITAGIFRSDYMLHINPGSSEPIQLKQVEFNTWSCAGGVHAQLVADMHRHLSKSGAYIQADGKDAIEVSSLPANENISAITSTLRAAHQAYTSSQNREATKAGILMVVQPNNVNIADERPIEYALWNSEPPIPLYRVHFGTEVLTRTKLADDRTLLYEAYLGRPPVEISVVYHRAGLDENEYEGGSLGIEARTQLERSRAIQCPSVLAHLAGFKKVQQTLSVPGMLERFISKDKAAVITDTMVPMYPLDESTAGQRGRVLAEKAESAKNFVMKPSLEGGGHNIYREDIPQALKLLDENTWRNFILMELITPPTVEGLMMTNLGMYEGPVVSELGTWGGCLWKTKPGGRSSGKASEKSPTADIILNQQIGWSMRTKSEEIDEMSVVKGYGSFDSPRLV